MLGIQVLFHRFPRDGRLEYQKECGRLIARIVPSMRQSGLKEQRIALAQKAKLLIYLIFNLTSQTVDQFVPHVDDRLPAAAGPWV